MSGQDERPTDVAARWDPSYSDQDFVPDRCEPFSSLASDYLALCSSGSDAATALANVVPGSWTGDAASAFSSYVDAVVTFLNATTNAVDDAARACTAAAGNMDGAIQAAKSAASRANSAQDAHRSYEKDNFLHKLFADDHSLDLDLAVGMGNVARGNALSIDKTLTTSLSTSDDTLSSSTAPQPPNPLSESDPNQAALLAEIMQPVAAALSKDGDSQRARDAVNEFDATVGSDPRKAAQLLAQYGGSLTSAELTYLYDHVDESNLRSAFGALDPTKDRELYNSIAQNASLPVLTRLADDDPNHYWHPATGGDAYIWANDGFGNRPLDGDPNDIRQGALGDCHDMSALAAVEQAHPGYLESHITRNANGTYTVMLYKDGKQVPVTITPDVPYMNGADGSPIGSAYSHGGPNGPTVYQVYEKAMAQSNAEFGVQDGAGYASLSGGWPYKDYSVITGQSGNKVYPAFTSPDALAGMLAGHHPVTADTPEFDSTPHPTGPDGSAQDVIGGHSYRVVSVDVAHDPATVTLANPWDPSNTTNGTITVSWTDFQKYYDNVDVGSTP